MNIQEKFLSTLKAVKTMTSNENIYDENNKPLFNIDEEINNLTKKETSFDRFNFLVNQLESIHSNLVCTVIELFETTNGEAIGHTIVIDGKHGRIDEIMLAEMNTYIIMHSESGDKLYFIKQLANDELISIGLLF